MQHVFHAITLAYVEVSYQYIEDALGGHEPRVVGAVLEGRLLRPAVHAADGLADDLQRAQAGDDDAHFTEARGKFSLAKPECLRPAAFGRRSADEY